MTDFRVLCAQLADYLQGRKDREYGWPGEDPEQDLLDSVQAALAQPELQGPSDEELYDYWISTSPEFGCADPVGFARAVLARWGNR